MLSAFVSVDDSTNSTLAHLLTVVRHRNPPALLQLDTKGCAVIYVVNSFASDTVRGNASNACRFNVDTTSGLVETIIVSDAPVAFSVTSTLPSMHPGVLDRVLPTLLLNMFRSLALWHAWKDLVQSTWSWPSSR